ncbi:MAG: Cob(I)yrinic acid a,c-diamide adenosyltransferase [Alphaproteobacteria bacterium MarineAlpha11_Bin1]|nr:MAG: Cob(I)yrinic acid a,c-diamide adenosyltransferase [Alphaproteobacteria bacterium MarineAlpha11_Bin1]|tara:strand:+ start:22127 stop:22696 length:570 start_codon:yes stop_codon:yes gene_type:complete
MVKLDKIYTRGGDAGETSLGDGSRVAKNSSRIIAQGDIDETNAVIGLARCSADDSKLNALLARVQNDLFDLGADLTRPGDNHEDGRLRIQPAQVERLELEIDAANEVLEPLKSFIIRGGTDLAANMHFACSVCRRAERAMVALADDEPINPHGLKYINRLSDLLFVLARQANDNGNSDILWMPGEHGKG